MTDGPPLRPDASPRMAGTTQQGGTADPGRALIVASAPVDRIVLSRIAERACLKVAATAPAEAGEALAAQTPGLVIVDLEARTDGAPAHEALFARLAERRAASPDGLPLVIGLARSAVPTEPPGPCIDATVAKPVTPETLQPLIERLVGEAGARV